MANFTKSDLYFDDYNNYADSGDNPNYIGIRDRIQVDKTEVYEVVYFCNSFLEKYQWPYTKFYFQKVERIIRKHTASKIVMRTKLEEFVCNNQNIQL
ncbi:hypothetical protein [Flavobacterium sp. MK4S-17]|uniref:hypothetical protein n=1 Tax=Flavobacterium sp. MK4S-17 TaxID=2543737 RepID=UPI0013572F69|nr:hypothetical protein [Flavobacterium sp. MK4S-17]